MNRETNPSSFFVFGRRLYPTAYQNQTEIIHVPVIHCTPKRIAGLDREMKSQTGTSIYQVLKLCKKNYEILSVLKIKEIPAFLLEVTKHSFISESLKLLTRNIKT